MSLFWTEEESEYQHRGWKRHPQKQHNARESDDYLEQGSHMKEACFEEPQRVLVGSQLKAVHSLATSLRVTTAPIGMLQEMLTFHIAPILRCLTDDTRQVFRKLMGKEWLVLSCEQLG